MKWQLGAAVIAGSLGASPAGAQQSPDEAAGRAWREEGLLHVETGPYAVRFIEKSAWTIRSADFQGKPLLTPTGAYQSVIKIKKATDENSTWIGTGHGGEEVESLVLEVDGRPHDVEPGLDVQGTTFSLVKKSILGPFRHTSRVTVSAEGIEEEFDYTVEGDTSDVTLMYAFMHCFTNETQEWIAGLGDGTEVRGKFLDDNSFTLKKDIRWATVYAPSLEIGAVYAYPEVYEGVGSFKNSFWNRPRDNKLYLWVDPQRAVGESFGYSVRLRAFEAAPEAWETTAREVLEPLLTAEPTR